MKSIEEIALERGASYYDETTKLMLLVSLGLLESICKAYMSEWIREQPVVMTTNNYIDDDGAFHLSRELIALPKDIE